MLSIGKIRLNGENYYVEAVADGIDEYYRGVGEAPGRWTGTAAPGLGLDGEVEPDDLHAVWSGLDPGSTEPLGRFRGREIAGFDLTFKAPKSVSLLAAFGDPDTAAHVRNAHEAAVDAAFDYLERHAAWSRTGHNGVNRIEVNGLIAAAFRHRTSRLGDPHLHTHVLAANMAESVDGKWRTLDWRAVYLHSTAAGYLYEAQLRHELTTRLGVEWGPVKHGIADVVGIDKTVRDHFSDRRKEILEHLDDVGFRTARAADIAAVATRRAKASGTEVTMQDLWDTKAAEIDWEPASVADCLGRHPQTPEIDLEAIGADLLGPDGLTQRASTFDRRDLLRGICDRLPAGATVAQIEDMADAILERPEAARLLTREEGLIGSDVIRRNDGKIVAAGVTDARWSTVDLMAIERDIVDRAVARTGEGCCVVPFGSVADVLARRPTLSAEQVTMVRTLCRSGNGIDVVSAAAGTGKTFTLDAMRDAWEISGHRVLGAALAGIAAEELRSTAGIASSTLAMLRINLDAGLVRLDDRTILVIDEVGMAGTRTLAPILAAAHHAGSKVVLVGDPHQLPEIDAGGVLRGLTHRLEPVELLENRRQRDDWERHALAELRHGTVDRAFATYQAHGRVVEAPTAIHVRRRMVADWWAHEVAGERAAMFAYRRSDTDDLNARARVYRVQAGKIGGPELVVDERPYQAGDHIICLRNNRRLGVNNGTRGTVTRVDTERRTITITIDTGRGDVVTLPAEYVDDGHIAHGYATTIHKTQGATVDHGLLLGTDELSRERGYVGMSRGRLTNHLYLVGATPADDTTGHGPPSRLPDPVDAVRAALHQTSQQHLAIDSGDALGTWTVEALVAEQQRIAHVRDTGAVDPPRS